MSRSVWRLLSVLPSGQKPVWLDGPRAVYRPWTVRVGQLGAGTDGQARAEMQLVVTAAISCEILLLFVETAKVLGLERQANLQLKTVVLLQCFYSLCCPHLLWAQVTTLCGGGLIGFTGCCRLQLLQFPGWLEILMCCCSEQGFC